MKRILIIGSGGAGKSTLSVQLGNKLGLPVVHLDREFWRPGWVVPTKEEWLSTISRVVQGDKWILDGNFDSSLYLRLPVADTLIFLDFSRALCLWRIINRRLRYWNTNRPDMAQGCNEQIDWQFLKWIWKFPDDSAPGIKLLIEKHGADKKIIVLKKPSEVTRFLQSL